MTLSPEVTALVFKAFPVPAFHAKGFMGVLQFPVLWLMNLAIAKLFAVILSVSQDCTEQKSLLGKWGLEGTSEPEDAPSIEDAGLPFSGDFL